MPATKIPTYKELTKRVPSYEALVVGKRESLPPVDISQIGAPYKPDVSMILDIDEVGRKARQVLDLSLKHRLPINVVEDYYKPMTDKPEMDWPELTPLKGIKYGEGIAEGGIFSVPATAEELQEEPFVYTGKLFQRDYGLPEPWETMMQTAPTMGEQEAIEKYYEAHPHKRPRQYKNFIDELLRNLGGGTLNVASGIVGTAAIGIEQSWGASQNAVLSTENLHKWAQQLYEKAGEPAYSPGVEGGWRGFIWSSIGQAGPYMGAAVGATIVTGTPLGAFGIGFAVEGDNAYRDAIAAGASEEDAQLRRFLVGTINGAIEQMQISQVWKFAKAGKGSAKQILKAAGQKAYQKVIAKGVNFSYNAAKHAAREGLEESLQEFTSIAAQSEFDPSVWDNATYRITMSGLGGGVVGLIYGAGGRVISQTNKAVIDKRQKTRLVTALKRELNISSELANRAADMVSEGETIAKVDEMLSMAKYLGEEAALAEVEEPTEIVEEKVEPPAEEAEKPPSKPVEPSKPAEAPAIPPKAVEAKPEGEVTKIEPEPLRKPVTVSGKTFHPQTIPVESIGVDAKKFQFKLGAKLEGGVTEALKAVEKFDPIKAGTVLVWQDGEGKYWVIDGHHRVALARKTGQESLDAWVVREEDGWTASDARAVGALRNLADGKGTAVDAAKLFRDSNITLEQLRKEGVPTENTVIQQGMEMKNLSDEVFRMVIDERLPANMAAVIGRDVKGDAQQRKVAELVMEGEVETVRQAEFLAMTIDSAPVLTKQEQTLFGLETTEKSLYAERAKILANVERKLKTNKKVFGTLASQAGLIESKGNILERVANLKEKEMAEEVLYLLEKFANAKGEVAEALNEATKEYAKYPTKDNLAKITNELVQKWTETTTGLTIQNIKGLFGISAKGIEPKVEKPKAKAWAIINSRGQQLGKTTFATRKEAQRSLEKRITSPIARTQFSIEQITVEKPFKGEPGFVDLTPLQQSFDASVKMARYAKTGTMNIVEPSKAVEIKHGKEVYATVIKGVHKADVARIEFDEKELETLDGNLRTFEEVIDKYPISVQEDLMLARGKPKHPRAIALQNDALQRLAKDHPELIGTRKMITRIGDFTHNYLREVVGDKVGYVEDYFYGIYKDSKKVQRFLDYWKTTERFTKEKKWFTYAEAKAVGELEIRNPNPVTNIKSEFMGISRLDGMIEMRDELMRTGKDSYISEDPDKLAYPEKIPEPIFKGLWVDSTLAQMIKKLISANKVQQYPALNALRVTNNFLRSVKFLLSGFHHMAIIKHTMADSGYLGFIYKPTAYRWITRGFKKSDPRFKTEEYKGYISLGGGHRYSIASEAQRAFVRQTQKLTKSSDFAIRVGTAPLRLPVGYVKWLFENYIPEIKYVKYLDHKGEMEKKLGRSLDPKNPKDAPILIDIIKEGQNIYGMMNERLFGRSGTVTSLMRFKFMSPGFAEGNFRQELKGIYQWGQGGTFTAGRSRADIFNSFLLTAIAATIGTIILIGKPPKKPEGLGDIRDLFKIDTGKLDLKGRRIMIDLMSYDRDFWTLFGKPFVGEIGEVPNELFRRLGGMTSTTWEIISDLNQMSMGYGIYNWNENRVVEITDPFARRAIQLILHEAKKAEPISINVFWQARERGLDRLTASIATLLGTRPTTSEKDRRESRITRRLFAVRDRQERLYYFLGSIKEPRRHIDRYNKIAQGVLDNPITTQEMRDKWGKNLIIDTDRLISNKVHAHELLKVSEKPKPDELEKTGKWLKNFGIEPNQYRKHLIVYEMKHRKLITEMKIGDADEMLKDEIARFYADKGILGRLVESKEATDIEKRKARKYEVLSNNISKIGSLIHKEKDVTKRKRYYERIRSVIERTTD